MQIFSLNEIIREKLIKLYNDLKKHNDIDEARIKYIEFINNLEYENKKLYLYLVSLAYLDNYAIELSKYKYGVDNNYLMFEDIDSIEDLLFKLNIQNLSCDDFFFASLKMAKYSIKKKAMALCFLDDDYISKFNKYYLIEKYNLFNDKDFSYLVYQYQKILKSNSSEYEVLKAKAVDKVLDILNVQLFKNPKNYNRLICEFTLKFYTLKKYLKNCRENILFEYDEIVIELVEKKNINEIISFLSSDYDILSIIVEDVIDYETMDTVIDKNDVLKYFDDSITEEIKVKLKEV